MPYNAEYRKMSIDQKAKILAYVLNGWSRSNDPIPYNKDDLKFVIGGVAFKPTYDFVSKEAFRILMQRNPERDFSKGVKFEHYISGRIMVKEHPIPVTVMIEHICEIAKSKQGVSEEQCRNIIDRYAKIALISAEEDARIRNKGLNNAMPQGWSWEQGDIFARYKELGIESCDQCGCFD